MKSGDPSAIILAAYILSFYVAIQCYRYLPLNYKERLTWRSGILTIIMTLAAIVHTAIVLLLAVAAVYTLWLTITK